MRDLFRRKRPNRSSSDTILSQQQNELLAAELAALEKLSAILDAYPATDDDKEALEDAAEQLTSLFLLVVVGEFNSGKSAFLNALVGARIMPEGVTPTTSVINLLQYGETQSESMLPDGIIARTFPRRLPRRNHACRHPRHERDRPRARGADPAVRAPRRSGPLRHLRRSPVHRERAPVHGRHPRVGQEDHDHHQQDRPDPHRRGPDQVIAFVTENIERLLGFRPEVFPVSALLAQQAKRRQPATRPSAIASGRKAASVRSSSTSSNRSMRRAGSGSSCSARSGSPST